MKRITKLALASIVALAGIQATQAQTQPAPADARAIASDSRITGKVTAIDQAKRMITVRNSGGDSHDFVLDEQVKNFDQIKVGDKVTLEYRQAIALELRKGGDGFRESSVQESATSAPLGEKPAGMVERTTKLVSNVTAVDAAKGTVTLKTPKGKVVTAAVQDPAVLASVKKGDQVVATIYESVAVAVTAAPKK